MEQKTLKHLLDSLAAAFERDSRIEQHHYPVRASLHENMLLLEGTVKNMAAKKVAISIARQHAGAIPVLDNLRLKAEAKEDKALRDDVVNTFLQEPVFTEYSIYVSNNDEYDIRREGRANGRIDISITEGTVKLDGNVGSLAHRRLAEVLMWWLAGCQAVENGLKVVPPEEDDEGELTDAIRIVLEKDPLVHASQLSVSARGSTVTLAGSVASQEEKNLAVLDAWCVPGVWEVVDQVDTHA